jgi:hypothetical protein
MHNVAQKWPGQGSTTGLTQGAQLTKCRPNMYSAPWWPAADAPHCSIPHCTRQRITYSTWQGCARKWHECIRKAVRATAQVVRVSPGLNSFLRSLVNIEDIYSTTHYSIWKQSPPPRRRHACAGGGARNTRRARAHWRRAAHCPCASGVRLLGGRWASEKGNPQ